MIDIENYPVFMKLGHYSSERKFGQTVLISVRAHLKEVKSPITTLSQTVDYGEFFTLIDKTLKNKEIKLLESAIELLGSTMLRQYQLVHRLHLTMQKNILPGAINKGATVRITQSFDRDSLSEKD